jgi:hypothetical protein
MLLAGLRRGNDVINPVGTYSVKRGSGHERAARCTFPSIACASSHAASPNIFLGPRKLHQLRRAPKTQLLWPLLLYSGKCVHGDTEEMCHRQDSYSQGGT